MQGGGAVGEFDAATLRAANPPRARYAYGKLRDRKGWCVLRIIDDRFEEFGPYRTQKEARTALLAGLGPRKALVTV
jgi:hypothetical protein